MKTRLVRLGWWLALPFRLAHGAYTKFTYRHRDSPELFELILHTQHGQLIRGFEVFRNGARLGYLLPKAGAPAGVMCMSWRQRWLPIAVDGDGVRYRQTASWWRWTAVRSLDTVYDHTRRDVPVTARTRGGRR
jgi:hypothetical protein